MEKYKLISSVYPTKVEIRRFGYVSLQMPLFKIIRRVTDSQSKSYACNVDTIHFTQSK